MIYRLEFYSQADCSLGFAYCGSAKQVRAASRQFKADHEGEEVETRLESSPTPKTKSEVIALLGRWGSHNDNG